MRKKVIAFSTKVLKCPACQGTELYAKHSRLYCKKCDALVEDFDVKKDIETISNLKEK